MGYCPPPPPKDDMGRRVPLPPPRPLPHKDNMGQSNDETMRAFKRQQWREDEARKELEPGSLYEVGGTNIPTAPLPQDPVVWLLPDSHGRRAVPVPENPDAYEWATDFADHAQVVVQVSGPDLQDSKTFEPLLDSLGNRCKDSLKKAGVMALLGLAWIGFGFVVDRRIPEGVGFVLTGLGLVAIIYGTIRHGYSAWSWLSIKEDASDGMRYRHPVPSTLLDAIASAIEYRENHPNAVGDDPNLSLLDAKAYEELMRNRNIPLSEIVRLAKTLEREMGGMNVREVADRFGMTLPAAAVYKDLAGCSIALQGLEFSGDKSVLPMPADPECTLENIQRPPGRIRS